MKHFLGLSSRGVRVPEKLGLLISDEIWARLSPLPDSLQVQISYHDEEQTFVAVFVGKDVPISPCCKSFLELHLSRNFGMKLRAVNKMCDCDPIKQWPLSGELVTAISRFEESLYVMKNKEVRKRMK